ncbi:Basic proline-rich protein precursor [[Actinomadura] parvosata subsp. kistnae]|nr:Basic proline-rich protein precursor [Actinomadura parvosata subsp. kistnae]
MGSSARPRATGSPRGRPYRDTNALSCPPTHPTAPTSPSGPPSAAAPGRRTLSAARREAACKAARRVRQRWTAALRTAALWTAALRTAALWTAALRTAVRSDCASGGCTRKATAPRAEECRVAARGVGCSPSDRVPGRGVPCGEVPGIVRQSARHSRPRSCSNRRPLSARACARLRSAPARSMSAWGPPRPAVRAVWPSVRLLSAPASTPPVRARLQSSPACGPCSSVVGAGLALCPPVRRLLSALLRYPCLPYGLRLSGAHSPAIRLHSAPRLAPTLGSCVCSLPPRRRGCRVYTHLRSASSSHTAPAPAPSTRRPPCTVHAPPPPALPPLLHRPRATPSRAGPPAPVLSRRLLHQASSLAPEPALCMRLLCRSCGSCGSVPRPYPPLGRSAAWPRWHQRHRDARPSPRYSYHRDARASSAPAPSRHPAVARPAVLRPVCGGARRRRGASWSSVTSWAGL